MLEVDLTAVNMNRQETRFEMRRYRALTALSAIALVVILASSPRVIAQPYGAGWHTIDGGGAAYSAGTTFELSGTVGQHDASTTMAGTQFKLEGGFWNGSDRGTTGEGNGNSSDPNTPSGSGNPNGNGGDPNDAGSGVPTTQSQPACYGSPDCGAGLCGAGSALPLMLTCMVTPLLRRRHAMSTAN